MSVQAVSGNSYGLVNLLDSDLKQIAYDKAAYDTNDKRQNRLTKAMLAAVPVVAGVSTAVLTHGSRTNKAASGLKDAGGWVLALGVGVLINSALNKLREKSAKVREFTNNHPVLTVGGVVAAFVGAYKGIESVAGKVANFAFGKKPVKKGLDTLSGKLEGSKILTSISKQAAKVTSKVKVHSAIKSFGKGMLFHSPLILLGGALLHAIRHQTVKNREFVKNYTELKDMQAREDA